jgi:DNA modification methylase
VTKLFESEHATLWHGDCLEVMRGIPDGSIDMVWTDPPYGNNNNNNGDLIHRWENALGCKKAGEVYEDRSIANDSAEDSKRVVCGMLTEASRVLKKDCCCCCCGGGGGPIPLFAWFAERMDRDGFEFDQAVVWDKMGLGMGWKYRRNYELVMVAHRKGGTLKWEHEANGPETANVVRISKIIPQVDDHPTPKPISLLSHFLRLHAKPGDVLLDPFCGAGPSLIAGLQHGMRVIGIEIDERWALMTKQRLEAWHNQGQLALHHAPSAPRSPLTQGEFLAA